MPSEEIKVGSRVQMVIAEVRKAGLRIKGVKTGTVTGITGFGFNVRRDGTRKPEYWHRKFWQVQ